MSLNTNVDGFGGTGLSVEEAIAFDTRTGGAAPPVIENIARRLVDGALMYGVPFADVIFNHCVHTLQLSSVDQGWILYHWVAIMRRQH